MKRLMLPLLLLACQRDPWGGLRVFCDRPVTSDRFDNLFIEGEERSICVRPSACTSRASALRPSPTGYDLEDPLLGVTHVALDERPDEGRVLVTYDQPTDDGVISRSDWMTCMVEPAPTLLKRAQRAGRDLRSAFANDELSE